ncbi:DUF2087 domain-containing protein [Paenibacillus sp. JCM 10914]|uniref:DUF2087 domain-containing protein n=1 Tax=Paenibacillus sp. JCM 10914 TaxID=1236974 RepID=UPI0003CC522D|nr:DUF2087 domain-containing protein [Paenibacillus sp. JCM 10914]GAE04895.1 hypothetical protein JCM10914_968 [Paenibacillus sp. JCM 10914]
MEQTANAAYKASVLRNFLTEDGRISQIPAKYKKKIIILEYMAEQLELGRTYPEKEINDFIQQFHADYATIRREFIIHHYMRRNTEIYECNPRDMWTKWEQI